MKVFLNDKFIPLKSARVSILDRGFLYGDGVFETMRSYNGQVFKLERHIDRLLISLKILRIKSPYRKFKLSSLVNKTLRVNKLSNAYVKLIVTRGIGKRGVDISDGDRSTVVIYAAPLKNIPITFYKKGLKVNLACISKNEQSFIARIKSLNYVDNILARAEVQRSGFDEAIFLNSKGNISEATTSNIFMVKKGSISTPTLNAGLLPGITRGLIIEIIRKYFKNKIYERNIKPAELISADEIFLTNSILEVVSVIKLGKKIIGKGKPGVFTNLIHSIYRMEVENV